MIQPTLGNQGGFFCVRPVGRTFLFSALESGTFSVNRLSQRTRVRGSESFLKTRGSGPFALKTEGASGWGSTASGWVAFLDRDSQRSYPRFRCRFTVQHPVLNPCYRGSRAYLNDGSRCSRWATGSPRSLPRNFRGCLERRGGRKGLRPPSFHSQPPLPTVASIARFPWQRRHDGVGKDQDPMWVFSDSVEKEWPDEQRHRHRLTHPRRLVECAPGLPWDATHAPRGFLPPDQIGQGPPERFRHLK